MWQTKLWSLTVYNPFTVRKKKEKKKKELTRAKTLVIHKRTMNLLFTWFPPFIFIIMRRIQSMWKSAKKKLAVLWRHSADSDKLTVNISDWPLLSADLPVIGHKAQRCTTHCKQKPCRNQSTRTHRQSVPNLKTQRIYTKHTQMTYFRLKTRWHLCIPVASRAGLSKLANISQ